MFVLRVKTKTREANDEHESGELPGQAHVDRTVGSATAEAETRPPRRRVGIEATWK